MIKRVLVIAAMFISLICHAEKLTSYDEVTKTIIDGKGIRAVLDISLCKGNFPTKPGMIGSVKPKDVAVIVDKYVTFSNLHFTRHHPASKGKPMYESTQFTLKPNHQITMETVFLDPLKFNEQGNSYIFECELNNGVNIYSVD